MKKATLTALLICSLFLFQKGCSQALNSIKIPDMSPYTGTWVGTQDGDSLIVEFELKDYFVTPLNRNIQVLYGNYEFITDVEVEKRGKNEIEYPLQVGLVNDNGPRKFIGITFRDKELGKTGQLKLYVDEKNDDKLEWRLSYGEGIYINATKAEIEARKKFSVPTEMTLYRRE
jgi:hypothetical protein